MHVVFSWVKDLAPLVIHVHLDQRLGGSASGVRTVSRSGGASSKIYSKRAEMHVKKMHLHVFVPHDAELKIDAA